MGQKRKTPARRAATPRAARRPPVRRQPETLRLRAVLPSLTVDDVETSLAWYRDVLGFMVVDEWLDGDRLVGGQVRAGRADFLVTQDDFAKGRGRDKGQGVLIYCQTAQNVDRLAAQIEARGGVLERAPADQPWGSRDFTLLDPDGYRIAIASAG